MAIKRKKNNKKNIVKLYEAKLVMKTFGHPWFSILIIVIIIYT